MPCPAGLRWDLFCRVIDNHGDVGVCWRLAADLASRGELVRLWIDDASALGWMAPQGAAGVQVLPWPADPGEVWAKASPDRVIEAFGCDLPALCRDHMARLSRPPVWINLEYLSAEGFVERSHGLMSPPSSGRANGAPAGLRKWFYFPGFTECTGGLIREPALAARQGGFDAKAWLRSRGIGPKPGERVVSLFCYARQPALAALLDRLAETPTLLLATAGSPVRALEAHLGTGLRRGRLRAVPLPWLTQPDYDHLLWACDLNFVRGEDSFVRAQWAGKPFVWQPYRQSDGFHLRKLDAFLDRFLDRFLGSVDGMDGGEARFASALRRFAHAWADGSDEPLAAPALPPLPDDAPWQHVSAAWRSGLTAQADLVTRLIDFAAVHDDPAG